MTTQSLEEVFTKLGRVLDLHERRRDESIQKILSNFAKGQGVATTTPKKARVIQAAPIKTRRGRPAAAPVAPKATKRVVAAAPVSRTRAAGADRVVDRMVAVMGDEVMGAAEVVAALIKAKTAPQSENLQNYISFMLSQNPKAFKRVARGKYQVILGKAERVASARTSSAESGGPAVTSTEKDLDDLGINTEGAVASNPFPT